MKSLSEENQRAAIVEFAKLVLAGERSDSFVENYLAHLPQSTFKLIEPQFKAQPKNNDLAQRVLKYRKQLASERDDAERTEALRANSKRETK